MYPNRSYINQYRQTRKADADPDNPYRVIALLLSGAIERVRIARAGAACGDVSAKLDAVSSVLPIIEALRASLDHQAGGEIAAGLESVYEYASRRLVEANANNDADKFEEVAILLGEIETAWSAIPANDPLAEVEGDDHG